MSALPPKADIGTRSWNVRFVPKKATKCIAAKSCYWITSSAATRSVCGTVFFYLLPTALVAILYGVAEGALFAVAAFVCSAFLLYDPVYSFYVRRTLLVPYHRLTRR